MGRCTKVQRNKYLKTAPSTLIRAVGDSAKSLLEGDLPISRYYRKKLRKDIKILKKLANRSESIATKKKVLNSQKGSSVLGVIWNVIKNLF